MDNLRTFFNSIVRSLLGLAILALITGQRLVASLTKAHRPDNSLVSVLRFSIGKSQIVLGLTILIWFMRYWGWRIAKPRLDVAGTWVGKTTYTHPYLMKHNGKAHRVGSPAAHRIVIKQDCLSIRLTPSDSDDFINWGSTAVDMDENGRITYAYWVRYADADPQEARGYEELDIVRRGRRGRPTQLSGLFWQCVQPEGPVYSGTVTFSRERYRLPWSRAAGPATAPQPDVAAQSQASTASTSTAHPRQSRAKGNVHRNPDLAPAGPPPLLVLGANSSLGAAIVAAADARGAKHLLAVSRSAARPRGRDGDGVTRLGHVDLLDDSCLERLGSAIDGSLSDPFVMIHSVGDFWRHKPFIIGDLDECRQMLDSHVATLFAAGKLVIPRMMSNGGGRIVTFSCNSVRQNYPDMSPFTSSKAAVESITRIWANEYAPFKVATTALALPTILTPEVTAVKAPRHPDRYLTPEKLAEIILDQIVTAPAEESGNVISLFRYNEDYFGGSYFGRNPREEELDLPPTSSGAGVPPNRGG